MLIEDHTNAELIYSQIVKMPGAQAINKLYYGLELRSNGKYEEAAKAFNDYAQAVSDDPRAKELANGMEKMKTLAADPKIYTVTNVASQNSAASEFGVAFYKDGIIYSLSLIHI